MRRLLPLLLALSAAPSPAETLYLRAGRLLPASSGVIEDGAVIVLFTHAHPLHHARDGEGCQERGIVGAGDGLHR